MHAGLRSWLAAITLSFGLVGTPVLHAEPSRPLSIYPLPHSAETAKDLPNSFWYDSEWGWLVFEDPASAQEAAAGVRAAVAAFYLHFGILPTRGAVMSTRLGALHADLTKLGASWIIPWSFGPIEPLVQESQSEAASNVAGRLIDQGFAEPLPGLTRAVHVALGQADTGASGHDMHHIEARSALRHEIAHALFLAFVIPNTRKPQYGGDAPDWLDEAAALIAETNDVTALRRRHFADQVRAGRVPPLAQMLTDQHPVFAAPAVQRILGDLRKSAPTSPVLVQLTPAEAGIDRRAVADFYAQSRAIVDYLIARSGDVRILGRIAASIRETGDPLAWVETLEPRGTLPKAIDALNKDFADWSREAADETVQKPQP